MLFFNFISIILVWVIMVNLDCFGYINCTIGSVLGLMFEVDFGLSDYGIYIMLMLLVCSNIAFLFMFHYFGGYNINSVTLLWLLGTFVFVMFMMVNSCSLFNSLVLWEYLGLVSFLLVAYYDNSSSLRGSLITLVSSRFGDVAFFLVLALSLCGGGVGWLVFLLCWVIISTKSACFPFGAWLLEAMRAPTPVSSLVHSSTLVAAGAWFLICYYDKLGLVDAGYCYLFSISCCLFTVLCSGVSALVNADVKQIVALSTCNNVAWILLFGLSGDVYTCLLQLMVHAVSKCLLFTYVGDYILSSSGGQSANQMSVGYYGNFFLIYVLILLFGLSGLPFVGLYFSKHLFLGLLGGYGFLNVCFCVFMWGGMVLSCGYCVRLFMFFFSRELFVNCVFRVSFMVGLFVMLTIGFYTVFFVYDVECCGLGIVLSLFVLLSSIIGLGLGLFFSNSWGGCWARYLFGQDLVVQLFEALLLRLSIVASVSLFRWETWLVSLFKRGGVRCSIFGVYFGVGSVFVSLLFIFFCVFFI